MNLLRTDTVLGDQRIDVALVASLHDERHGVTRPTRHAVAHIVGLLGDAFLFDAEREGSELADLLGAHADAIVTDANGPLIEKGTIIHDKSNARVCYPLLLRVEAEQQLNVFRAR